jgi:hypothetical protein
MNPLFLKAKAKHCLSILFVVVVCNCTYAIDSIPDSSFNEQIKSTDAYLLYNYTDVAYTKSWRSYRRHTTVESKMVINNRSGVEKYAFLNLNNSLAEQLESIKIKTLKADGSVLELDSSLVFRHKPTEGQMGQVNYPIPGVEPGDTIEVFFTFSERLEENELGNFVYLFGEVPSINTEYSISVPPYLNIKYKLYNDFPEPYIVTSDTLAYCLFKKESAFGVSQNQYTCAPCELPHVYYSVYDENREAKIWKDVYNLEFNVITQPLLVDRRNSSHYKRWKRRVLREAGDSTKYHKLELLLDDIYTNFSIEPTIMEEVIKSSGFFIKRNRFDPLSIRRLYRQILEDLEIDYWAVFARSKRMGNIDPYFIRNQEFDHIFFAYEDDKGSLNLLYPHEIHFKFQPGEIPTSIYNTEAVIAKPYREKKIKRKDRFIRRDLNLAEVDSVVTDIVKLPGMDANLNYIRQIYYCDVDIKNQSASFHSVLSVSGGLSTDIRSFFGLLDHNKEVSDFYDAIAEYEGHDISMKIDTITRIDLKDYRPFIFNIGAEGTAQKGISFINDSIVSITLNDLIQHNQIESEDDSIDLNYYLDYSFSDQNIFIVTFPVTIELLGQESFNKEIENDYGKYTFNLQVVNKNQLSVQSSYSIIRDVIPNDDYDQLKQLNDFLRETNNLRILVKLKDI